MLARGYARLKPCHFVNSEEEHITGELVRAMEEWLDEPQTPPWANHLSVHEEARVHCPGLKGKKRKRLDIRIDSSSAKPRPRFCFEAKRLGPGHGVSIYLGSEGLGRYLDGSYARECPAAGMLGYVQERAPSEWASEIGQAMKDPNNPCKVVASSPWRKKEVVKQLDCTYCSGHRRQGAKGQIEIYHTLLLFN
jgi:hypothetical protein